MSGKRVGWGIISSAGIARKALVPAISQAANADLVCLGTPHPDRVAENRQRYAYAVLSSYEAVLHDPRIQAVYIPLPNGMHREWSIRALRAGKHVLCEKPFTVEPHEAREVIAEATAAGRWVMEAFMYRFHPQIALARSVLDSGRIGELRLLRAAFSFNLPPNPANPRYQADQGPGALLDVGCYCVNAARYFCGGLPIAVQAWHRLDQASGGDLSTAGVLEFSRHAALIDCSFEAAFRSEIEIVGERGRILLPRPWLPGAQPATVMVADQNGLEELATEGCDHYRLMVEYFGRCILEGTAPEPGPEDALDNMRVLTALRKSADEGRRVRLDEVLP